MPEKRRILLVDDHAALRHAVALVLAEDGFGECRETAGRWGPIHHTIGQTRIHLSLRSADGLAK